MPTSLPNLYALLVGIDNYHPLSRVRGLNGCVADILAMDKLLRLQAPDKFSYHPALLRNEEATYSALWSAFESHLGRSSDDDIVLFMFSGHGSKQATAVEFLGSESEVETLVCYDSRLPGHYDLADKEVAVLLSRILARHLVVIFDCCHGGSGTRNTPEPKDYNVRMEWRSSEKRSLESYAMGYYAAQSRERGAVAVPTRPHLLLAACAPHQLAAETCYGRGAFSSCMEKVLSETGFHQSYESLFERTRAIMLQKGYVQTPQFECHAGEEWQVGFLGLRESPSVVRPLQVYEGMPDRWFIDFGAAHGLPEGASTKLYVEVSTADEVLGTFPLYGLGPERSEIALSDPDILVGRGMLSGRMEFIGLRGIALDLGNLGLDLDTLRNLLPAWVNLVPVGETDEAYYRLSQASDGRLELIDAEHGLLQYATEFNPKTLDLLMGTLVKVVHWRHVRELSNGSMETFFDEVLVRFDLLEPGGRPVELSNRWRDKELTYAGDGLPAYYPVIRVTNGNACKIHAYILHLGSDFSIDLLESRAFAAGVEGAVLWGGNEERGLFLPAWKDRAVDNFLVILSTEPIEAWKLTQRGFTIGSQVRSVRDLMSRCNSSALRWVCRKWEVRLVRE